MAVKFCVVAADEAIAQLIEKAARPIVALNPYDRELLKRASPGFPAQADIDRWAIQSNIAVPGSVTLRKDGSFSSILSIDDAQISAMIEGEFVDAA